MIAVVIPTYNEIGSIERICRKVVDLVSDAKIIIVDDNSIDGTREIVYKLAGENKNILPIFRHGPKNFSQSYLDGFQLAINIGADFILQMDADLSHSPEYIPVMLSEVQKFDIVIGSRYIKGGKTKNWSFYRRMLSRCGNIYVNIVTGLPLTDTTSGFVIWRKDILKKIISKPINANGYAFQIELKYRAWRESFSIKEIPITFLEREFGQSKMTSSIIREGLIFPWKLRFIH